MEELTQQQEFLLMKSSPQELFDYYLQLDRPLTQEQLVKMEYLKFKLMKYEDSLP